MISSIGGNADRAGVLRGDRIITINGINVGKYDHGDVVALLKKGWPHVNSLLQMQFYDYTTESQESTAIYLGLQFSDFNDNSDDDDQSVDQSPCPSPRYRYQTLYVHIK